MDREGKGILRENREGKGLLIIPYPYPPYRAGHVCAYVYPIAAPMGPMYAPIYGHVCAYTCPITAPMWPMNTRIHTLLSGIKIRTFRKAVKKRQSLCLIWTSLLALAIHSL